MTFTEYFETGEENETVPGMQNCKDSKDSKETLETKETKKIPDSLKNTDYNFLENSVNADFNSLKSSEKTFFSDLNEGLIDVIFKTIKTNLKVNVQGELIYFRWEWILSKTFFSVRVRKGTFYSFVEWVNKIKKFVDEDTGK